MECKVGNQERPRVAGKFGLRHSREKVNKSFAKRTHWPKQIFSSNNKRDDSRIGHHQTVNTKVRLTIFFAAKVGKRFKVFTVSRKLYLELTLAQVIQLLIAKSRLKLKKVGKTTRPFKYDLKQIPYD